MLIKIGNALIDPDEIQTVVPDRNEESRQILVGFKGGSSCWIEGTMDEAEAALIDAGVMTDLTAGDDETPLPDMDDEEIEKLCELEADGYQYVARDKDGKLYAYRERPEYDGFYWNTHVNLCDDTTSVDGSFAFIGSDDKEPMRISTLLGHLS